MRTTTALHSLLGVAAACSLAGCGGGDSAAVSGSLTGLNSGASVVLQDNDTDNLTLSANGSFIFAADLASGSSFNVTVLTQPVGQTCSVANGSGTVDTQDDPVSGIAVTCATSASIGGTIVGLTTGTSVTLKNGSVSLPVAVDGGFAFPAVLAAGTAYDVSVATQPAGLACTLTKPIGTVVANTMASVAVVCG